MRSVPVSKLPAGVMAFCALSVCCSCWKLTPSVASFALDNSIVTFSSCRPSRSTLATSGTRRISSLRRSA